MLGIGSSCGNSRATVLCDDALMIIERPCVVTLSWQLADSQGQPIDELPEPVDFFYGGDDLLAKVEEALHGQAAGHEIDLHLEPADAFGDYAPELVCFEDRALFPRDLEAGMAFEGLPAGSTSAGMPADRVYIATEIYPSHVVLDGNHPLAGMALRLKLKVRNVRDATEHEVAARSVSDGLLTVLGTTMAPDRLQ